MQTTHSLLSLAGGLIYLIVGGLSMRAALSAKTSGRPGKETVWWFIIAVSFGALIALRASGFEQQSAAMLRNLLREDGMYEMRREAQAPLSVLAILCVAGLIALTARLYLRTRPGSLSRILAFARLAVVSLFGLVVLRVISFHATDMLLYGPLKLNWVIDIGSSLFTGWCAWRFTGRVQNPRLRR